MRAEGDILTLAMPVLADGEILALATRAEGEILTPAHVCRQQDPNPCPRVQTATCPTRIYSNKDISQYTL
jgi:hypothetical protein